MTPQTYGFEQRQGAQFQPTRPDLKYKAEVRRAAPEQGLSEKESTFMASPEKQKEMMDKADEMVESSLDAVESRVEQLTKLLDELSGLEEQHEAFRAEMDQNGRLSSIEAYKNAAKVAERMREIKDIMNNPPA